MTSIRPRSPQQNSKRHGRTVQLSGETPTLFIYGTLQFPEVWEAIIGRVPQMRAVTIHGWQAVEITIPPTDRKIPALVPGTDTTRGFAVEGLTPHEWNEVDAFELDLYQLQRVNFEQGGYGWCFAHPETAFTNNPRWSITNYASTELAEYIERCRAWRQRRS